MFPHPGTNNSEVRAVDIAPFGELRYESIPTGGEDLILFWELARPGKESVPKVQNIVSKALRVSRVSLRIRDTRDNCVLIGYRLFIDYDALLEELKRQNIEFDASKYLVEFALRLSNAAKLKEKQRRSEGSASWRRNSGREEYSTRPFLF